MEMIYLASNSVESEVQTSILKVDTDPLIYLSRVEALSAPSSQAFTWATEVVSPAISTILRLESRPKRKCLVAILLDFLDI